MLFVWILSIQSALQLQLRVFRARFPAGSRDFASARTAAVFLDGRETGRNTLNNDRLYLFSRANDCILVEWVGRDGHET